jgi:prevent-host-death family protein
MTRPPTTLVTATEAARNFARLLDRAQHDGASFTIERHGRPVAEIRPPRPARTVGDLRALLREGAPDPDWERDLHAVTAAGRPT